MAKLFVSYSRRDSAAARQLIEGLRSIDQEAWVDWESIPPAVDWLEQIFRGIEEADAFIFLISPDSIASEVCKVEINRAAQNNKRIIPIVLRDVLPKDAPEQIRKLNWTFMRENDDYEEGLAKVKTAIELDLDWLEEHRRLQVRSLEWHRKKDPSLLLRGRDLRNARQMLATATAKDPTPTDLQKVFIDYSRRSERNRIITILATGIAVVALAVLSFLATEARDRATLERNTAVAAQAAEAEQRRIAQTAQANEAQQKNTAVAAQINEAIQKQNAVKNENVAEAQRSAARAQIYRSVPGELYTSTLLAMDSWNRDPSDAAEEILRRNLSLLPRPVTQFARSERINALTFSPDNNTFVAGSADGTTCAWKIEEEGVVSELFCTPPKELDINAVAFSPDGSQIAIGDQSGLVQLLDVETGDVLYEYQRVRPRSPARLVDIKNADSPEHPEPLGEPVRQISFRPGSGLHQLLAIAYGDGQIPVLNLQTGEVSSRLSTVSGPNVMGFSPNGGWLVAGSPNGGVSVWNLSNHNDRFSPSSHQGGVSALAFSPRSGDNKFATAGNDNTAIVNLSLKKQLFRIPDQTLVRDLAFSPDGSRLVTAAADGRIRVWNPSTGVEELAMVQGGVVSEVVFSSDEDGKWIATTGEDRTARVWDAKTGAELFQIPLTAAGSALGFCNNDQWLVTTDESGIIAIWDLSSLTRPALSLSSAGIVNHIQYSPSGEWLAVSSQDKVWLLTTDSESIVNGRQLGQPVHDLDSAVKSLVFSPDSRLVSILAEENELVVYDLQQRTRLDIQLSGDVQSIAFSPDSGHLIGSASTGSLQVWDAQSGEAIPDANGFPQGSSLASASNTLAIGSQDEIILVDSDGNADPAIESSGTNALLALRADGSMLAASGPSQEVAIYQKEGNEFTRVASIEKELPVSLAFQPNGNWLAIGTAKNVFLIDVDTGMEVARIPHPNAVNAVSFSADGKYLATASGQVLQFWDTESIDLITTDDLLPTACTRLPQGFDVPQLSQLFEGEEYAPICARMATP